MEAPLVGLDLGCLAGPAHLSTAPVKRVECMHQSSACMPASALQVFGCASYMLFHGPLGPALSFLVRQGSKGRQSVSIGAASLAAGWMEQAHGSC